MDINKREFLRLVATGLTLTALPASLRAAVEIKQISAAPSYALFEGMNLSGFCTFSCWMKNKNGMFAGNWYRYIRRLSEQEVKHGRVLVPYEDGTIYAGCSVEMGEYKYPFGG